MERYSARSASIQWPCSSLCWAPIENSPTRLLALCNGGLARGESVDPSDYYFRISPTFETGRKKYSWLNRILAVGIGRRMPSGPIYDIYEIL